jgi:signal transduction histidine kinase/CheY-like chemotaxis protein
VKLRTLILLFLLVFGLTPLVLAVAINLPLVLDRTALFYQKAYLQNLRADFRDLDQHLASRHEMIRLLAKLPEPGLILGAQGEDQQIDLARARYTGWINQILGDQRDIIQILFLDSEAQERFWLERDEQSLEWHPTTRLPESPSADFLEAGLHMQPGGVMVSRIRIEPVAGAEDPRQLMMLSLVSAIGSSPQEPVMGLVVMSIDVGGLAQFYRNTLWVNNNGSYLRPGQPLSAEPEAFSDFPGLDQIFAERTLALWHGESGERLLWVPMFVTEDAEPLWVGRRVDPSPLDSFRNALILRVGTIVLLLILVVLFLARWIATRAERFGQDLTRGVGRVVHDGESMRFHWKGPQEVQELAEQLTTLAETHVDHLRSAREHTLELERSNRYKSEFLANVSHELRTPLNSILLLSKMLADRQSGLSADQQRQAGVINEAGRDLRTMIDNILDISRIEAGQVAINLEWIALRPMAEELLELVAPQFNDKGLYLDLEVADEAPEKIYSDRDKLRQILKNFLSNAAKFTEDGGVTVSIGGVAESGCCPIALSVRDTGIGIPEDKQQIIFDAFQQADGSTRRRYGGTGLGLSISRELAQLLGGTIRVESSEGRGSRFTLLLPVELDAGTLDASRVIREQSQEPRRTTEKAKPPFTPDHTFAGRWVLLVERDVTSLVAETQMLESFGLRVQTAADAEEAHETLLEESSCSLILLAELVSVPNTCDTIRAIRGDVQFGKLPIVVIGSAEGANAGARFIDAGADSFVPKPVARTRLEAVLTSVLGTGAERNKQQTA